MKRSNTEMFNMKKVVKIFCLYFFGFALLSCNKSQPAPATPPTSDNKVSFSKGADVGWLTQMEASGLKFYDSTGAQQECMSLLKSLGMNSIRLRVWVKPTGGWNSTT